MDSIGSYAESLILKDLQSIKEGSKSSFGSEGMSRDPECPDISTVDLTDAQRNAMILGENISHEIVSKKMEDIPVLNTLPQTEEPPLSDPIMVLVEQLSYLVEKAESLVNRLDEMAACGSIGTNQKFNLMQSEPFAAPPVPKVMKKVRKLRKYRR